MAMAVDGQLDVICRLTDAWQLFNRFEDVARLIPTLESVEVDGDQVRGKMAVKLGRLPVTSRVALEVVERKELACIKAEGLSYLGETIAQQVATKGIRGIDGGSVGRLFLHLDLRPTEEAEKIRLLYHVEVEAEGRLRRIYQSILKNKAPGLMEEFAENIRNALESRAALGDEGPGPAAAEARAGDDGMPPEPMKPAAPDKPEETPAAAAVAEQADGGALAPAGTAREPWWRRLLAWLRARLTALVRRR